MKLDTLENSFTIEELEEIDKSINIGEDILVPYSLKTKSVYVDNDIVYLRYLDYYKNMHYTKVVEMQNKIRGLNFFCSR